MDYEEKYKAALERAKQFSEKPYLEDSAGIVEYIFPELKEPELAELKDERIMKALIHFFSNDENTSFEYWEGIPKAEVLAWLKKQGEQKPTCLLHNSESNVKFPFKAKVKSNGKIVTIQGGQLSMDCKKYGKYVSNAEDGYMVYKPKDLELVCNIEQKPADKVEPKFKIGDWIIDNNIKTPFLITGISNEKYDAGPPLAF